MKMNGFWTAAAVGILATTHGANGANVEGGPLDEIVVTAQKSSEPLSKIPISITAVSGTTLNDQHITNYADLSRAVPNVSFSNFGGPGQSNIEIRGISSQAGSSTTGIYLDDVPINVLNIYSTGASEPRFFDIDRVEVLRGPQGTIYGASSMGGTLHFVSNLPDLNKMTGDIHSSIGGTQHGGVNYEADSVVNLPIVDGVAALRLGALYDHTSGWIDRFPYGPNGTPDGPLVGTNINAANTTVIRATLEWRPIEALTVLPSVFLQRVSTGGQDLFSLSLPEFQSPTLIPETARDEYAISSLTVKYDLGWSELTSVSGYFWRRDDRNIDGTSYDSGYIGGPYGPLQAQFPDNTAGAAAISALAAPTQFNTNVNQIHQELRLGSKPGVSDAWTWIAGLYYSRTRTGLLDNEHIPGFASTFQNYYGASTQDILGDPFTNDLVYYALSEFVNKQSAVFGQVTYKPLDKLKVTLGARYEKATEELKFYSAGYLAGGTPNFSGSAPGHALTPKAAVSYEVTDNTLVYASAAEGYRDGGINRPVPAVSCAGDLAQLGLTEAPNAYKADKLWSYEVGAKSRAFDRALTLSGAVFDIRWNNIQTDILLPTCTFDIKDNIGSAESRGIELEFNDRFSEHWSASLGGNFTSAKIVVPVTILGVQRGDHVPGVPSYTIATTVDYTTPVASGLGRLSLNGQWTGPSQGTIYHGDPDFDRPSYFVMGGTAGIKWARFDLSLFITNLLNADRTIQRPNVAGVEYGVAVRPRTIGVSGSYSF